MSIIFGICRPKGQTVHEAELRRLASPTSRYAPEGTTVGASGRIGMGFQHSRTHRRSELEAQPLWDEHGNALVLDGRIDNHRQLQQTLGIGGEELRDSEIVLAAFEHWREECFSKFVGDWALALWIAREQTLYLARDHAGTRTLYFEQKLDSILWSTHIDTFFTNGEPRQLNGHYVGRFLAGQPVGPLTPYRDTRAVRPAHYYAFRSGRVTSTPHWNPVIQENLRYKEDRDYEDQFFALFKQSVARRSEFETPVLAQLSGGMDSSSIVAMADYLRRGKEAERAELIDTVSFYDDGEPSWDERPYFSAVEAFRGKTGVHIEASFSSRDYQPLDPALGTYYFPVGDRSSLEREKLFLLKLEGREYRSILSGVGGDEILGGVPDCFPELADYLYRLELGKFTRQTVKWCMAKRLPFFWLTGDTIRRTSMLYRDHKAQLEGVSLPWMAPHLHRVLHEATSPDPRSRGVSRWKTPSSLVKGNSWWAVIENLPHKTPGILRRYEYLYPYLDKDLVDFVYRIPREQLIRPGQRRSLMKRALRQILPEVVLQRNSKAYVSKGPIASIATHHAHLDLLFRNSYAAELGYIDPGIARSSLKAIAEGKDHHSWAAILRTITLELWLRSMGNRIAGLGGTACSNPPMDALA